MKTIRIFHSLFWLTKKSLFRDSLQGIQVRKKSKNAALRPPCSTEKLPADFFRNDGKVLVGTVLLHELHRDLVAGGEVDAHAHQEGHVTHPEVLAAPVAVAHPVAIDEVGRQRLRAFLVDVLFRGFDDHKKFPFVFGSFKKVVELFFRFYLVSARLCHYTVVLV